MNHKSWLWRKRSLEKTIFGVDKVVNPPRTIEEEAPKLPADKEAGLERSSKSLNEKLASILLDSHDGDDLSAKLAPNSQEEVRGNDKSKQEVESLETKEDEVLGQNASANQRATPPNTTMQDSGQRLRCDQEEQEQRMCGTDPNISREHQKIQKELEEKLREASEKLTDLTIENTHLSNALLAKEKSIADMLRCKRQTDAEFSTLMARLDSTEKENAFLRYEFHMLEKEAEIQKEETDYSRQYADASHKQYLESLQKVSKLEAECQRLRLLLQKRPTGPNNLVNMKKEVGMVRGRKSNPVRDLIYNNTAIGNSPEASDKSSSPMIKRLQDLDEENKALKRILTKKNTELESSRTMYVETASRLSQAEVLLRRLSEDHKSMELARFYPASSELSLISKFDIASDDGVCSSGSWANTLISELEHLRTGEAKNQQNSKAIEVPEMNLLDDFVEKEKRAIVSADTPKREHISDFTATGKSFDWLQIVLTAMLEEKRMSKRSVDELIEDIQIALGSINHPDAYKSDRTQKSRHTRKSNSFDADSMNTNLSKSIHRIIKLIEGIAPTSFVSNNRQDDCSEKKQHPKISHSPTAKEYFVHVFQWKASDLNPLLHQFVRTCKDVLTGRAGFQKFVEEVAFALDWSLNNHAIATNASIARDKIRNHFRCHSLESENQFGVASVSNEQSYCSSPLVASPHDQHVLPAMENTQPDLQEENRKLKDDLRNMESMRKDLEARLLSVTEESRGLMAQLQEAQNSIEGLKSEVGTLKESKALIEDQIEKQKLMNEDLDTQLTIAHSKLHDIFQKFSSLEVELEDKSNSCEELEATCLELQLQLESIAKEESPACGRHESEKISHTGWEITKASSKLAECQETILNLGKQLKALTSSSDVALLTSTMANPTHKNLNKRSSLRSQMQAEDDFKARNLNSVQTEDDKTTRDEQKPPFQATESKVSAPETNVTPDKNDKSNATVAMAIVPSKKQGAFGFLKKLLLKRRKGRSKAKA